VQKVSLLSVIAALALVAPGSARSARPTVTVRVTDSRITSPRDGLPATSTSTSRRRAAVIPTGRRNHSDQKDEASGNRH